MKALIASHITNIYLKPGEVVIARKPVLISTVLGSCVAVTMYSPDCGFGAICHAMLPDSAGRCDDLRYVDTAVRHIYQKALECRAEKNLVVKLFGGATVLSVANPDSSASTVGAQNVARAEEILSSLGLAVCCADTGGSVGRKLYFCTRNGDVYLRKMRRA